eukprot:8218039-Pyramimonas_sp.AAC.1
MEAEGVLLLLDVPLPAKRSRSMLGETTQAPATGVKVRARRCRIDRQDLSFYQPINWPVAFTGAAPRLVHRGNILMLPASDWSIMRNPTRVGYSTSCVTSHASPSTCAIHADVKGYYVDVIKGYDADVKGQYVDIKGYGVDVKGYYVDI